MKRVIGIAIVVGAVLVTYQHIHNTGPRKTYEAFAETILHRQYESAATMTTGLTAADLASRGSQEHIGAGPQMFQSLFPSRFAIQSEQKGLDGSVELMAVQTVFFNPAGVESAARPAMYADLRQRISIRKVAGEWKIAAFENTFERMGEVRER